MLLFKVKLPSNSTATKQPKSSPTDHIVLESNRCLWAAWKNIWDTWGTETDFCRASSHVKRQWQKALVVRDMDKTCWPVGMTDALTVCMLAASILLPEQKLGWSYFPVWGDGPNSKATQVPKAAVPQMTTWGRRMSQSVKTTNLKVAIKTFCRYKKCF